MDAIKDKEENKNSALYRNWFGAAQIQTVQALFRRLSRACDYVSRFEGEVSSPPNWQENRLSVKDISSLHSIAKMFVVGAILKKVFKQKENIGKPDPKVFCGS